MQTFPQSTVHFGLWTDEAQLRWLEAGLCELSRTRRVSCIQVEARRAGQCYSAAFAQGMSTNVEAPAISIGCIAELSLAVVAHDLNKDGVLDLDTSVSAILPELLNWGPGERVKLRHLLSRSGGVQDPRSLTEAAFGLPWAILGERLSQSPVLLSPGEALSYSGADLSILMAALHRLLGFSAERAIYERVLEPLGIRPRPRGKPLESRSVLAGGAEPLGVSVQELARFVGALADTQEPSAFASEIASGLNVARIDLSGGLERPPSPHAAAWFSEGAYLYSDGLTGFNGQSHGQACGVRFDRGARVSLVVGVDGPPHVRDSAINLVAEAAGYADGGEITSPCPVGRIGLLDWQDLCGAYEGWAVGHTATVSGGPAQLTFSRSFQDRPLRSLELELCDGELRTRASGDLTTIRFFRDRTGSIGLAAGGVPYAKLPKT